jgi:hemerythrin superfamily protein
MKLEQIYKTLKDFAEKEEELISRYPCDSDYDVPTWDKIYDALDILDSIINYEPSEA